ncbi:hypothetical protein GCM10007094_26980 [Pseudovibrio japonicus]|uniref:Mechanosensitive ion channel MscS domain-containing protein n=1 Tax=Pseudovibrio japonicus TaxID=366534 RepID=A0ABQ3EKW6_9HYPH|nr:mechanosensitive ion channel family protein [Pseudovibrio japonicus]GHB35983.1 hypothetical protein GCM10007094_26980 [Pseudovibrio japonicus]
MEFHAEEIIDRFPLTPADTSSPRATLQSFIDIMEETNDLIMEAHEENAGMVGFAMDVMGMGGNRNNVEKKIAIAEILLERARGSFDLSELPSATRKRTSVELALQLKEILDRIPLPALEDIPGSAAGTYDYNQGNLEDSWTIPFTEITLTKVNEGPNQGKYLFSAQTVDRIPEFYHSVKELPSRFEHNKDLYSFYASSPGQLLPPAWFSFIEQQPAWILDLYYGQAGWQWIALIIVTSLTLIVLLLFISGMQRIPSQNKPLRRQLISIINTGVVVSALMFLRYLADNQINIGGQLLQVYDLTIETLVWIGVAFIAYKAIRLLSELVLIRDRAVASIDHSLIRTATQLVAILCALILLTFGATRLNLPLYGIIAGLSLGGLAIAFAAQPTLENLLGGLIIYADGIVRVGDYCEFNEIRGHVVSIGMRSTRVRTSDRTLVTIPNADLAKMNFKNFTLKDHFRVVLRLALKYDTSPNQLEKLVSKIKQMLAGHPLSLPDTTKVHLEKIDETGILLKIEDGVKVSTHDEFLVAQEDILLRTLKLISMENIEVAHPFVSNYEGAVSPPQNDDTPNPQTAEKTKPKPKAKSKVKKAK